MAVQTATILVTDLVRSTELRVRVGEERADRLRRLHDRALTAAAESVGGVVVKSLGDGVLVMFAGAAAALGAAVTMQQALELLSREAGSSLSMRIGISAGDVSVEGGDMFGTPVIEASRLCAEARSGEILVAGHVRHLVRGRGNLELVARGAVRAQGLPEPIEVCTLAWEPAQTRADLRTDMPFVGRVTESRVFEELVGAAKASSGGLLLVSGEPGIGKTRLVREMCDRPDCLVLWGSCHDGDVIAHAPFVEALRGWLRSTPVDDVRSMLGIDASILTRMSPAMRALLPDSVDESPVAPDEAAGQLHESMCQFLERLSSSLLVILVLDDLHWADEAAIQLLRAVARRATMMQLLVVGTYRETDLDRRHPLAQALPVLRRECEPTRIELAGLAVDDLRSLLERLSGHEVPATFVELLGHQTEGNPFFVRETLLHLGESGRIRFQDGAWVATADELGIPEGVREVMGRRLSQLSEPANRLLSVAALSESLFSLPIAAEVAELEETAALDALDEALRARIVAATDRFDEYRFTHALFRQVLAEELNPSRQVRLHRSIAEAVEKSVRGPIPVDQAATLMRHFYRSAALPGAERAARYAHAVAEDAHERHAYRQEYDALVVERELDPDRENADLATHVAQAAVMSVDDVDLLAREFERTGGIVAHELDADRAADVLAEALVSSQVPIDDRFRLGHIARQWLDSTRRDMTWVALRCLEIYEAVLADPDFPGVLPDTPEWAETRAIWLDNYFHTQRGIFGPNFANLNGSEAEVLQQQLPPDDADRPGPLELALGHYRAALTFIRTELDDHRARRLQVRLVGSLGNATRIESVLGLHDDAIAHLREATDVASRLADTETTFAVLGVAALRSMICGEDPAIVDLGPLEALASNPESRWAAVVVQAGSAWALARTGRTEEAIVGLARCLPGIEDGSMWDANYSLIIHLATGTLFDTERLDYLDALEHNLRTKVLEPDFRSPETDGRWSLARLCAVSGRRDDARYSFSQAREVCTKSECVALLVAIDYEEAVTESRFGNNNRALTLVESARTRCTHVSMDPWLTRLAKLAATIR